MVEREQDTAHRADEAVPRDDVGALTDAVASSETLEASDAEEAEFQRQMAVGRGVMRDFRAVLAALAK